MTEHGFLAQVLARDPRSLVRFPDAPVEKALDDLVTLHRNMQDAPQTDPDALLPSPNPGEEMGPFLCRITTHVWRAKSKMIDPATGIPREDMRRVFRHIEGAVDTLEQAGVTMQDWLNQPYDVGLPVKVLSYQPTAGISCDTILETLRPAVIWNGRMLQLGEVIVGTPTPAQN